MRLLPTHSLLQTNPSEHHGNHGATPVLGAPSPHPSMAPSNFRPPASTPAKRTFLPMRSAERAANSPHSTMTSSDLLVGRASTEVLAPGLGSSEVPLGSQGRSARGQERVGQAKPSIKESLGSPVSQAPLISWRVHLFIHPPPTHLSGASCVPGREAQPSGTRQRSVNTRRGKGRRALPTLAYLLSRLLYSSSWGCPHAGLMAKGQGPVSLHTASANCKAR